MNLGQNIISLSSSEPIVVPNHDTILSIYKLSIDEKPFN